MNYQFTHQGLTKKRSKIILISFGCSLLLLLSSCNASIKESHKAVSRVLTSEQQVKDAVLKAEKKSDDPSTWPKITKLVVIENYALVRYKYQVRSSSEMLLAQKTNKWAKVFGGDSIALNTMTKMKVPPQIAKKLLEKLNF
jgi:hypothetical protein